MSYILCGSEKPVLPSPGPALCRRMCPKWRSAAASALPPEAQATPQDDADSGDEFARGCRHSWARLSKKVYEANPSVRPRCCAPLKVISLIGNGPVVEKILRHLKPWDRPVRPPLCPAGQSLRYEKENVDLDEAGQWPDATA